MVVTLAALCFGYTVFSYFFVWTAAAAWLGWVAVIWIVARPVGWRPDAKRLIALVVGCGILLLPYFYLLSHRTRTMDDVQMLVRTHLPDLTRTPEVISILVIVSLTAGGSDEDL